ncbi:DUF4376 domain-containing protein [Escherichia coli]|nr:DUF4376 domain-containing protein [Escherichia coli]EFW7495329.1 DUF4376 domain-containing protein [Shigella sonnei]EMU83526.1 hypothetical protein ECMP0210176_1514 [Escherichia coli MP021017.6]EMU86726.1 hypothetical protein ECMP0210175_1096 [Escherichia coli MP021017.5]EMU97723.1 hypothetical protein ECMP0210173_1528 [Escherichia coli MP021017.3]EMV07981.1 hypothetical protein ECMP02101710_1507 [Escherichia coli MP021017.10]EMV88433.1 hypothetical protein EC2861200_1069 [Escherichia coli
MAGRFTDHGRWHDSILNQAQVERNDAIYQRQREMKSELSNLENLKSIRDLRLD